MVEDPITGEEFDSEHEMHLSWRDHWEELNSHQKDKVKKAERKEEEKKQNKIQQRKKKAGYGLAGAAGLALIAVIGLQLAQFAPTGSAALNESEMNLDERPVLGERDAQVTVVEFGDYVCPACRQFEFQTKEPLQQDGYFDDGRVNFYYLYLPVVDPVRSTTTAEAAECVAQQDHDEYWNYHSALFENLELITHTEQELIGLADDTTEIDQERFEQCLTEGEASETVQEYSDLARDNGMTSTPSVLVNGEQISRWDYNSIVEEIESELENQ